MSIDIDIDRYRLDQTQDWIIPNHTSICWAHLGMRPQASAPGNRGMLKGSMKNVKNML